jgi:hypothetical protein
MVGGPEGEHVNAPSGALGFISADANAIAAAVNPSRVLTFGVVVSILAPDVPRSASM